MRVIPVIKPRRPSSTRNGGILTSASLRRPSFVVQPAVFFHCAIAMIGGCFASPQEAPNG